MKDCLRLRTVFLVFRAAFAERRRPMQLFFWIFSFSRAKSIRLSFVLEFLMEMKLFSSHNRMLNRA